MIKILLKILKRIMIGILSVVGVITLVGVAFVNVSPQFGAEAKEQSLERIRKSSNFLNGEFKNSEKTLQNTGFKWSTIPKFFNDGNNKIPAKELPIEKLTKSYFENEPKQPRITWFG